MANSDTGNTGSPMHNICPVVKGGLVELCFYVCSTGVFTPSRDSDTGGYERGEAPTVATKNMLGE